MILNRVSSRWFRLTVKPSHNYGSSNYCTKFSIEPEDLAMGKFNYFKKAFYGILFTTVVSVAWYSKKVSEKRSELIKEAYRLNAKIGRMTLYRFRDFIIPEEVLPLIPQLSTLKLTSDDVVLCSFPKTGVTWLQEIVWLIVNDYDFTKALNTHLEERVPFLEWMTPGISGINKMASSKLIKTHFPLSILFNGEAKIEPKVISITRNPKDVAVSYYYFARMNKLIDFTEGIVEFSEKFIAGEVPFGPLHKHYLDCLKHSAIEGNKVLMVSYEDLHSDFDGSIKRLCGFLGKPFPDEDTMKRLKEHCHFKFMSVNPKVNYSHWDGLGLRNVNESRFFRTGQVGDWKNHLPKPIESNINSYVELHLSDFFKFTDSVND